MTLKDALKDWTDVDVTMHALGVCLGIFPHDSQMSDFKAVFWSANPMCETLYSILTVLVDDGLIDQNTERQSFRWKDCQSETT